jgi:ATP-dependent Clp protease ATP-binding subunit ClpA
VAELRSVFSTGTDGKANSASGEGPVEPDLTRYHFTKLVHESVQRAVDELRRLGHTAVRAEHLLLGVLAVPNGSASAALDALGIDRFAVRSQIEALLPVGSDAGHQLGGESGPPREYPFHATGEAVLQNAMTEARDSGANTVTTARILLGVLATNDEPVLQALAAAGVSLPSLTSQLRLHPDDPE